MGLTFADKDLEAEFAAHFGFRCRVPSFLLTTVMAVIWLTRLSSLHTRLLPFKAVLSTVFAIMAVTHSFCALAILRNAAVCSSERRKAKILVVDALACMITVMMYVEREELIRHGRKSSLLLVSSPFVVYSIHGWSVPFAGFRLVADISLHILNLQIYLFMRVQQEWVHEGPSDYWAVAKSAMTAFCVCSVVPLMINLFYEAHVRSQYLNMRRCRQSQMGRFWHTILKYSFYIETA